MTRRPTKDAEELDGLTRHHHHDSWRAGERKTLKQRANRRERRTTRHNTTAGRAS